MESSVAPRSTSGLPALAVVAFAAYGGCSLLFASSSYSLAGTMFGQALLYFAVAAALAKRASWAGWFAVGIATSGLVVDAVFLALWPSGGEMVLDTAAQAGLLWLAVKSRAQVGTTDSRHHLTSTAASPIGWTFALAAGVLPPAVMGALMPSWGDCLTIGVPWQGSGELMVLALLALGGLHLVARLRTTGLLALAAGFAIASSTVMRAVLDGWSLHRTFASLAGPTDFLSLLPADVYPALHPGHCMTMVAFGFAFAALLPLGPSFLRALFRGNTVASFRDG